MSDGSVPVVLRDRAGAATTIGTTAGQIGFAPVSTDTGRGLWSKTTTSTGGTVSTSAASPRPRLR